MVLFSCQASRVAVDRALSERVKGDEAQNWFRTECERDRGREANISVEKANTMTDIVGGC